jgi:DNA-binding MarR family transcriptional regulator
MFDFEQFGGFMKTHIGGKIRRLANVIKRNTLNLDSVKELDEITQTNHYIMGFIHSRVDRGIEVYQKDIENEFGITRSTASTVISLMEKKGLIIRESVLEDARLKKLVLTEKGMELNNKVIRSLEEYDDKLLSGFSDEEINQLLIFLERIKNNL